VWTYFTTQDRELLRSINRRVTKMAVDDTALLAAIADAETKEAAIIAALDEIMKELVAIRSAGGGATQLEIDAITARVNTLSTNLKAATDPAVAVEQPAPPAA
jgi:hypothetical protein